MDPARRQSGFEALMDRIANRFARVEPRCRAQDFILGLLSDLPAQELPTRSPSGPDTPTRTGCDT
ncbi:hypothetical protein GCM10010207_05840 [Streptomyces atratus]|uniref:hypothetical protein n=1 Tax=Streptomyces atratus TaxID=1893 RepID=UPI00166FF27A|nr:hypothetical protein [Streptomyces atratus]GGT09893.1 hypothetical protein GCM10010207_05840 [Streptomyces atratus]